ncbi:MAG: hypothetical protein NC080_05770 [Paraprevotella sp.]|nr:hypothetical protein [Paraprevotella sp.]
MKKTLLSLSTFLFGMGAWADVTDLPELSTAENPVYYVIHNTRSTSGGLIYFDGNNETGTIKDNNPGTLSDKYMFYFTDAGNGKVKICNKATTLKLANYNSWTAEGSDCTIGVTPHASKAGLAIGYGSGTSDYLNEQNYADGYTYYYANDGGSIFVIEKVEDTYMPENGGTYVIECPLFLNSQWSRNATLEMKGLTCTEAGAAPKWKNIIYSTDNDKWTVNVNDDGQISLKNVATQEYLNGTSMSSTEVFGTIKYLGTGQVNIIMNNVTVHAEGHSSGAGSNGNIVTWSGAANTASAWKFVKANENDYTTAYFDASPLPVTTDDSKPKCFAIKSGRGDNLWFTLTDNNKIHLNQYTGADTQQWYFKGTLADGNVYVQLFPKNGEGKAMSYENTSNGEGKIVAQALGTEGWTNTWKMLKISDHAAHYRLQTSNAANYLSNWGGASNDMGLYDGNVNGDVGTQLYFYDEKMMYNELMDKVTEANSMVSGTSYGYYKSNDNLTAALDATNSQTPKSTVISSLNALNTLKTAISGLEQIVPVPGFYRIINNDGNACMVSGTSGHVKFAACDPSDLNSIESVFYYDGEKLVSYHNGLYFGNSGNKLNYIDTVSNGLRTVFECDYRINGKCCVVFPNTAGDGNRFLHCAAISGEETEVVSDASTGTAISLNANHRFTVEPVSYLPVMKPADGKQYATLYSPVELNPAGRVEVFTAEAVTNGNTYVSLTKQDVIPANTGVLLKYVDGAETAPNNGYVYLPVQGTTATEVTSALQGSIADEYVTPENGASCYVLANPMSNGEAMGEAFYKAALNQLDNTAFINNGFKAYLPVTAAANARILFDFGTETGIESIDGTEAGTAGNAAIYDLSGRRVQKAQKGIYIINGKKVIK